MSLAKQVKSDATDVYNIYVKKIIVIAMLGYAVKFCITMSSYELNNDNDNKILYKSSDVGLKMKINEMFPSIYINLHSIFAILSVILIMIQKELIRRNYLKDKIIKYLSFWTLHYYLGYIIITCVLIFDFNGFFMRIYSDWDDFDYFSYFFFAPWIIMIMGIYFTAKLQLWKYHRLFGNMLLKGCIATPIARFAGSVLQNNSMFNFLELNDEYSYYYGIGFITIIVGLWQLYELIQIIIL